MNLSKNIIPKLKLTFYVAVIGVLVTACANEVAPSGGKKDTEPPKLLFSDPPNKSVNFNSKRIKIRFNEYLENSSFSRTLISPPTQTNPKIKVNLKTVSVSLPEFLEKNTTYIINFADDIRDINESNPLINYVYVFATGEKIDTHTIFGKVFDAFTGEPQEDVLVMLYKQDSLDNIKKSKPKYFAITDKSGAYSIQYLKPGIYAQAALKDQNLNFIYDQNTEKIGFVTENINLNDTSTHEQNILLFTPASTEVKIIDAEEILPGKIQIIFSTPVKSVKIDAEVVSQKSVSFFNERNDTLTIWHSFIDKKTDTLQTVVNDTQFTTLKIKLLSALNDTTNRSYNNLLNIDFQYFKNKKSEKSDNSFYVSGFYESLKIYFSRPVISINDSAEPVLLINDTSGQVITPKIIIDEKTKLFATLEFYKEENSSYTLNLPKGKFRDILGYTNDSISLKFQTNGKENYATLRLKMIARDTKYRIVEILASSDKKVKERIFATGSISKTYIIKNLPEGNYTIRVIEDENQNGEWDTGNFNTKTQPEKVRHFKDLPQLKGGWEAEFELKLD